MTKRLLILLAIAALTSPVWAQITIPNTFAPNTVISSSQMNANFSEVGTKSLNRQGGTITGNIVVNGGITIDGADISAFLQPTGKVIVGSTASDALDVAGGINAGSGNVGIVGTDGRVPALSTTYIADLNGGNLTGISFANIVNVNAFTFGGSSIEGRSDSVYPSGASGTVLAPGMGTFQASTSGNYVLYGLVYSTASTNAFVGLFNLTDFPDTEMVSIISTNPNGAYLESGTVALTAGKLYGIKLKVASGVVLAQGVGLKKVA